MKFRNLKLPKPIRWLVRTAGVLLVFGAVIIGLAGREWFQHTLQHRIEAGMTQALGGKVEIAGFRFQLLELKVSARRVIIHGLETDTGQPLFSAQRVAVNISPESLLQFRLVLRTFQWQQAVLHVRTYPDGSNNLPGSAVSPGPGQGVANLMNLGIRRLTLSQTTLYWNDQRIPFQVAARNVAIQLQVGQNHHYLGTIASSNAVFDWKARRSPHLSFATSFKLSNNQVEISGLNWQIENLRGHLAGTLRWAPQLTGNFEFRINGGVQELVRAVRFGPIESGYLYVDGKGAYDAKGLTAKGRVQAHDLKLKSAELKPGSLSFATDYRFANDNLKLLNFTLAGLKARAQGDATVSFARSRPQVVLHSKFKDLNLSALMRAVPRFAGNIGIFHPQAIVSGVMNANWRQASGLQSQFDLQLRAPEEPASSGLPLSGHVQGSIALGREDLLTLNDSQISTPHSIMTSQGTLGAMGSSLTVKFVTSDFEDWRPVAEVLIETKNPLPVALHSQAIFTGTVSGTFSNPEIDGRISIGNFNYRGWVWDSLHAGIQISPQQARIQAGQLKLGKSSLVLNARTTLDHWKLEPYSAVQLQATAKESPVAGLRAVLNLKPSMQGVVSGQIQAEGTVESLSGRGRIAVREGEFAGVPFDSLSANVLATKSTWQISDFQFVEGHGRAEGSVQVNSVERTFSVHLQGRNYPLNHIHFLKPQAAGGKGNGEISGLVAFALEGEGTFDNAQLHSTLDITSLAWKGQSLGNVHCNAEWQGRRINLQVKGGEGQAGNFQISGNIETADNWPLRLSGRYSDFRVDPWIEEFSGHAMGAEVSASGSFAVQGPLKDRSQLSGSSQVRHLQVNFPALQLSNDGPVEVSYAGSKLQIKQFRLQGQSTNFEVSGAIQFGHPPSLDISARGRAAATLLSLFAKGVEATGESNLEVRVRGSLAEPQLSGEIQVKDVGLSYTDLPFRLNALNGAIKLEGERAAISSLKGTIGGGAVNIAGFMVLQESLRYQIRTQLSQVRIRYPSDFTSVLDGNLTLTGTAERGQINGNIAVRNLFANENLSLVDLISGSNNPFGGPSVTDSSSFASRINLNVDIASARPVRIETHDLQLVSDIELHLQGTLANPVAMGNIYLRSGTAIFRGNRYTLTRGDISMTNPFRTEPVLDLQVDSRVDKYDLTLEVSGPPDKVRFSYRSDPPLPTQDILSLLAFGYSRRLEEFAPESRSPFSSMGTSALLAQALSNPVTGRIQRLFGVSRIKYTPSSTELGTLGGPVLTVEQQLSSNLTLTYQTSTANSQYRVIEFEFVVNPRMSVRGFRDQNGIFGLELKFRKRFK